MKQRIKIVCCVTNDLTQDRRMHRICTSLSIAGYDVTLVGRKKHSSKQLATFPFSTHRLTISHQQGPLFYWSYNQALTTYLLQTKPHIIYAVDTDTLLGAGRAVGKLQCKFIYDAHEYFTEVPELEGKHIKKAIWKAVERKYIPQTHLRFTVAQGLADVLERIHGAAFFVVRNTPTKPLVRHLNTSKSTKTILYQGVLNKGRGLTEMIAAMQMLDDHSIQLKIVGGGDIELALQEQASKSSAASRIHFMGWQTGPELEKSTQEAWLGINLLDAKSLNYRYSLANKFFDYMHAGIPSINMDLPEYRKIISAHKVGLLLGDLQPATIATAINSLDDKCYLSMVDAASLAAEKYCWQADEEVLLAKVAQLS